MLEAGGAPPAIVAKYRNNETDYFYVWPENLKALEVFLDCITQWRITPGGAFQGIEYTSLISVIQLKCKRKEREQTFNDVRRIEYGALQGLNHGKKS